MRFGARVVLPALRFAARVALPAVRLAALAVLRAARSVVRAADRAAVVVERATVSAALPTARGDVIPVNSAARSVSCAIPSTPAANPRPMTVAPDSISSPTARADCSITESLFALFAVVSVVRCAI
jgi:hypothetical protein